MLYIIICTFRFGHWKSVFSSMLIQKNNLTVNNEEPLGEGTLGKQQTILNIIFKLFYRCIW